MDKIILAALQVLGLLLVGIGAATVWGAGWACLIVGAVVFGGALREEHGRR